MKIKVKYNDWVVQPKRKHGKVYPVFYDFDAKIKQNGILLYRKRYAVSVQTEIQSGVVLKKLNYSRILKQWD